MYADIRYPFRDWIGWSFWSLFIDLDHIINVIPAGKEAIVFWGLDPIRPLHAPLAVFGFACWCLFGALFIGCLFTYKTIPDSPSDLAVPGQPGVCKHCKRLFDRGSIA